MPQMGESIVEGTITKWIKKVGDKVERDEPLFEISTDKVDTEIPAPVGGVLTAIAVEEGTTVKVGTPLGVIEEAAGAMAAAEESKPESGGVAVDVLSSEPPEPDNPLLTAPNCIITPHFAWATSAARQRLLDESVANVRAFLSGQPRNVRA